MCTLGTKRMGEVDDARKPRPSWFIHLLIVNQPFLSACCALGTVLGIAIVQMNKMQVMPILRGLRVKL